MKRTKEKRRMKSIEYRRTSMGKERQRKKLTRGDRMNQKK